MPDRPPVRSVHEFQNAIDDIKALPHTHIRLYRGQREAKDLLPSLFRKFKTGVHLVHDVEARMLKRLKERIPERTPGRPNDDWDWLSFGQHYRLATRLLDWSKNPLVALFFAVEQSPISPTVYLYQAQKSQIVDDTARKCAPADITKTRIMRPSVHSVRVALQEGWHTVHRLHPKRRGGKMVIPLADMEWHEGRLAHVKIDRSHIGKIRSELKKMGLHHPTIYGDFEKVCVSICRECGV
jgi:hypothetical protein